MAYAVLQTGMQWPEQEDLKRAFAETPGLVAMDAFAFGPDAFGMLAQGLEQQQAIALQESLARHAVEASVINTCDLPKLPEVKILNRLDCTPEALLVYDALGRSSPVAWQDISIIGVGNVMLAEFKRVATPNTDFRTNALDASRGWFKKMPLVDSNRGFRHVPKNLYHTEEELHQRLLLELIIANGSVRYAVNADNSAPLLFQCLGQRRTKDVSRNFSLLTQDLILAAPNAALNRGAYYISENPEIPPAPYASKTAFHNELIWLMWLLKRDEA